MKQTPLTVQNSPRLIYAIATALVCSTVSLAPSAAADSDQPPCGVLNEIRGSLDDDISAGVDGVRTVISSPLQINKKKKKKKGFAMFLPLAQFRLATSQPRHHHQPIPVAATSTAPIEQFHPRPHQ